MKKIFRKIHLWLAIPFGIIVTILCLSGAILVFETEITEWTHHDRYFVKEVKGAPLPLDELIAKVNLQLDTMTVSSVQIPSDLSRNYLIGATGASRATVYVDPYTGELIEIARFGDEFFGEIRQLHRWLLDGSRKIGKPLVGYTTLFFVFILITGIIVWWPKSRKHLKQHFQVKTKYGLKRFWIDMHTTLGMYAFIGLLALALTGLTYSFQWYNLGLYKLLGVELSAQSGGGQGGGQGGQRSAQGGGGQGQGNRPEGLNTAQWATVLAEMKDKYPNFKTITIQDGSVSVVQKVAFGNARAFDRYTFEAATSKITDAQLYKDQTRASKVRGWIFTLHVGSWGGVFSKTLMFIVALIGAGLPITGYYIFFIKRKKKKRKK